MAEAKSDRRQALELAIAQIERQFGKGSVMRLGAGGPLEEIAVIPTGALSLDVALGVRTKVKVVKNKLAPPFREAEFDVLYGEGISKTGSVLDAGVDHGLIEKSGTWYTFKSERIGQGRENAKKWLQYNPVVLADLESKLRDTLGLRQAVPIK